MICSRKEDNLILLFDEKGRIQAMSISREDFYELHRKNGNLYVTKGKQNGFSSMTCLFVDESASSPRQIVDNWVRSWHNDLPTNVTITGVGDSVWSATYVIVGMLSTREFWRRGQKNGRNSQIGKDKVPLARNCSSMLKHVFSLR